MNKEPKRWELYFSSLKNIVAKSKANFSWKRRRHCELLRNLATWQIFLRIFADISLLVIIGLGFGKKFVELIHSIMNVVYFHEKLWMFLKCTDRKNALVLNQVRKFWWKCEFPFLWQNEYAIYEFPSRIFLALTLIAIFGFVWCSNFPKNP